MAQGLPKAGEGPAPPPMGGMKSREEKDFKGRREGKNGMESCRGRWEKEEKIGGRELF